ncbi:unnamed protein product [Toxocara canis]|uniref:Signal peptide peptidase-like 2B n=1 Tax=Toxocara canis TaxID=6265 RepID=A0A183UGJ2_TOXCA|nr:unnamed protein product [Toxocara canis]
MLKKGLSPCQCSSILLTVDLCEMCIELKVVLNSGEDGAQPTGIQFSIANMLWVSSNYFLISKNKRGSPEDSVFIFDAPNLSDDHVVMFCHMGMPRTQNESTELPLQMQRPHTLRYALTVIGCYFAVTLVLRAHNPSGLLYTLFCALILENISVCYQGEGLCADEPR